jgi:fructosamine-3-kinase
MDAELSRAISAQLGAAVRDARPVSGGDINRAFRATLDDGRSVFVKSHPRPPRARSGGPGMFAAEAVGLRWLGEAGAIRVPEVLACGDGGDGAPAFLALEWIEPGRRAGGHDEQLGRGLAALHRAGAEAFGLHHDNFIAVLPQENAPLEGWPEFYRARRLEPQLRMAVDAGSATAAMREGFARLWPRLETLCGDPEPPARLHGDLWGGNAMTDSAGAPVLIDPAVYGGHREIDLAMMRLFGGFSGRVFAAYAESYPLADGHAERVGLYQLYPLMVHVNLFGGGYAGQVESILSRLA